MRARLEQWFWCFKVPIWLKFSTNSKWWKEILFDESNYKIIKSALEKYANDELESINDVARFLYKKWLNVWTIKNWKVYNSNLVSRMLKNVLYAWYLEFPKWKISRRKASHNALISLKTFEKIERKINNTHQIITAKIISNDNRIDRSDDFPLRWYLYCEQSKYMISGSWSKGKNWKFPYYSYPKKSPMFGKSINRDKFHEEFELFLKQIQPQEKTIIAFEKAVDIVIKNREENKKTYQEKWKIDIKKINKKIETYIQRIWESKSEVLIKNYELQIENLEKEKAEISQNLQVDYKYVRTPLQKKLKLARNSLEIWKNSNLENKRLLLKNIFPQWIPVNKKKQVGTPTFSLIYQSFSIRETLELSMVDFINENLNTLLR